MKIVIHRVKKAEVKVVKTQETVGKINSGLFVLLGIKKEDTQKSVDILVEKLSKMRLMADCAGKINLSVMDAKSEVLVVSQFTLYGDTSGGNRPSFINAEEPKKAKVLYHYFVEKLKEKGIKTETGSFGEYMEIETVLDGPVTILIEN